MSIEATPAAMARAQRPPVTRCERRQRRLIDRYCRQGELGAREELIEELLPLARRMARRFAHSGEPGEDLFQVACVGLIKAVDRFEPRRGSSLRSYAIPTMVGELKRHLRDKGWALRVPRDLQEHALAVTSERRHLTARLGRSPTVRELAEALGSSVEEVLEATEAGDAYRADSLDAPVVADEYDAAGLVDTIGADDRGYELVEEREVLAQATGTLSRHEREVIGLRFTRQLTQSEIAALVGCSQMQVSRTLRRALDRMHAEGTLK